jgi:hypothetical protein
LIFPILSFKYILQNAEKKIKTSKTNGAQIEKCKCFTESRTGTLQILNKCTRTRNIKFNQMGNFLKDICSLYKSLKTRFSEDLNITQVCPVHFETSGVKAGVRHWFICFHISFSFYVLLNIIKYL